LAGVEQWPQYQRSRFEEWWLILHVRVISQEKYSEAKSGHRKREADDPDSTRLIFRGSAI